MNMKKTTKLTGEKKRYGPTDALRSVAFKAARRAVFWIAALSSHGTCFPLKIAGQRPAGNGCTKIDQYFPPVVYSKGN